MEPDFYAPYQGGYLPMKVIRLDVAEEGGGVFGLREVRMVIEAVSVGAPVAHDATPTPRDVDPLGRGVGGRALEGGTPAAREGGRLVSCARCGQPLEDDNCPRDCGCDTDTRCVDYNASDPEVDACDVCGVARARHL